MFGNKVLPSRPRLTNLVQPLPGGGGGHAALAPDDEPCARVAQQDVDAAVSAGER